MDYLEKFNNTFNEFIDDIINLFPKDADLRMYKNLLLAALCVNDKAIVTVFKESVVENYGQQLLAKDETFFLNHDYSEYTVNEEYNAIINKIRSYWTTMNEENHNTIWKYFKVLILLSKKIVI